MTDPDNTTPEMLVGAAAIGRRNGLRYVYAGNAPGRVGDLENTRCHRAARSLIERDGYHVLRYRLTPAGCCPECGTAIPGRWANSLRRPDQRDAISAWELSRGLLIRSDSEHDFNSLLLTALRFDRGF